MVRDKLQEAWSKLVQAAGNPDIASQKALHEAACQFAIWHAVVHTSDELQDKLDQLRDVDSKLERKRDSVAKQMRELLGIEENLHKRRRNSSDNREALTSFSTINGALFDLNEEEARQILRFIRRHLKSVRPSL